MLRSAAACLVTLLVCACSASTERPSLGPVPDGVQLQARAGYYDVTGRNVDELRVQLRAHGPVSLDDGRRAIAQNRYNMRWRWQYHSTGVGGCEIPRVNVRVDMALIYPRWLDPDTTDTALVAWWRRQEARLKEHEEGHGIITLDAAERIVRTIRGMSGGSCDALGIRANGIARRIFEDLRARQRQFDASSTAGQRAMIDSIRGPSRKNPP